MSSFLTKAEINDIINFAKNDATGLASICYVTGYSRDDALNFLKSHMTPSEYLTWFHNVNEYSSVKMPIAHGDTWA